MNYSFYEGKSNFSPVYEIRNAVFVKEQGFSFESEFDDKDETSLHLLVTEGDIPVGTARMFFDDEVTCHLGRICILKEHRGKNIGAGIMEALCKKAKELGAEKAVLGAQVRASGFYEKQGFTRRGEIFMDEFCPHIMMEKKL